jgi:hypothetical protein
MGHLSNAGSAAHSAENTSNPSKLKFKISVFSAKWGATPNLIVDSEYTV